MTLNPLDLQRITGATLKHYNEHAEAFWQGTRDHDVSQNIEALLTSIEGEPPFTSSISAAGPAGTLRPFANLAISRLASMARSPSFLWRAATAAAKSGTRNF